MTLLMAFTECVCDCRLLAFRELESTAWPKQWLMSKQTFPCRCKCSFTNYDLLYTRSRKGEILRRLALGRAAMTGLNKIWKDKDITISTKCRIVNALVFPVVLYGCESWTIRKAERRRIDSFELWCWRRLLRIPWTARRTNKSVIDEIKTTNPLELSRSTNKETTTIIFWTHHAK